MRATITPQFGGKLWALHDKVSDREFFFSNPAHQPANIGARGAWVAGGLEFNWSPGYLGHSAFTEERVWAAKLTTARGEMVRIWEYDRYNGTVFQVDVLLDGDELWTHVKVTNPHSKPTLGYWWTCAAHTASPGTRILAPAELVTVETYVGAPLRNAPWPDFDNGMLNSTFGGVPATSRSAGAGAGAGAGADTTGGSNGASASAGASRLTDSSYLGNIAYTGDYFLRVPNASRKWIAHVDDSGEYAAVHGHSLAGTKFFTWGQSGPGRFMQDFLAGGKVGAGYYTELQSGVTPTQQQVFTLEGHGHVAFTEYFKPRRGGGKAAAASSAAAATPLPPDYPDATAVVGKWWDSKAGVPQSKVETMEAFFKAHEDRAPQEHEVISRGSAWGALHERLAAKERAGGGFEAGRIGSSPPDGTTTRGGTTRGTPSRRTTMGGSRTTPLAPGVLFGLPEPGSPAAAEAAIWLELVETGTFSNATLASTRAPRAYAVDGLWRKALEASVAAHGATWLHQLLLAVAYAEAGEVTRPRAMLRAALADHTHGGAASPVVARNLAVLEQRPEDAWPHYLHAWNLTCAPAPRGEPAELTRRLAQNVADEVLAFLIGNLPGATKGAADVHSPWFARLVTLSDAAERLVGPNASDTILVTRVILQVNQGSFDAARATLASECFPTLGRGRDVLLALWRAATVGREAAKLKRPLTPVEAHRARRASPVPRNIGCPYATLYCENYW